MSLNDSMRTTTPLRPISGGAPGDWDENFSEVLRFANVLNNADEFSSASEAIYYFEKPYKWDKEHDQWVELGEPYDDSDDNWEEFIEYLDDRE